MFSHFLKIVFFICVSYIFVSQLWVPDIFHRETAGSRGVRRDIIVVSCSALDIWHQFRCAASLRCSAWWVSLIIPYGDRERFFAFRNRLVLVSYRKPATFWSGIILYIGQTLHFSRSFFWANDQIILDVAQDAKGNVGTRVCRDDAAVPNLQCLSGRYSLLHFQLHRQSR